jgi:hypothetical protein
MAADEEDSAKPGQAQGKLKVRRSLLRDLKKKDKEKRRRNE